MGLRRENSGVEIRLRVEGMRGQCRERMSIRGKRSWRVGIRVWGIRTSLGTFDWAVHRVEGDVGEYTRILHAKPYYHDPVKSSRSAVR